MEGTLSVPYHLFVGEEPRTKDTVRGFKVVRVLEDGRRWSSYTPQRKAVMYPRKTWVFAPKNTMGLFAFLNLEEATSFVGKNWCWFLKDRSRLEIWLADIYDCTEPHDPVGRFPKGSVCAKAIRLRKRLVVFREEKK